jgi:hypothetical protein
MELLGYIWLGIFVCMEIAAFIVGCVGLLHVRELGGRLAGLAYGIPTLALAATPPTIIWSLSPGFAWWHTVVGIPYLLGCFSIYYGFKKRHVNPG